MRRLVPLLVVVLAACGTTTTEGDAFAGIWESVGFGTYLVIGSADVGLYEYTSVRCGKTLDGSAEGISAVASLEDGQLVIDDSGRVVRYDRLEALPPECVEPFPDEDPALTFQVLVATFEEHYAFLDDRDPDWSQRAAAIAGSLTAQSTDAELFSAVVELLRPLGDAQVRIVADDDDVVPEGRVWAAAETPPAVAPLHDALRSGRGLSDAEVLDEGAAVTGRLAGGAGYLGISSFAWLGEDPQEAERQLARAVDGLLAGLGDDVGLVIDLRANQGGFRDQALAVASRFVPDERTVVRYEARVGGTQQYVDAGVATVRPMPSGVYGGQVVVLTGPGTVGAAELLVVALLDLPNVTVVGEPTAGSLSPLLARTMPNGWSVGLGNTRTIDAAGRSWEITGIPPDVDAPVTAADLAAGGDPGLDAALEVLAGAR